MFYRSIDNTGSSFSTQKSNQINVTYSSDVYIRTWSTSASCSSIACTQDNHYQTTFCFQKTSPGYYFQWSDNPREQEGKHKAKYSDKNTNPSVFNNTNRFSYHVS